MSKLLSRKFLLACIATILFALTGQPQLAAGVVAAYLGVEGIIDHKGIGRDPVE